MMRGTQKIWGLSCLSLSKYGGLGYGTDFVMTIQTALDGDKFNLSSSNNTFDFVVDWGDGSTDHITSASDPLREHTYATAGYHQLRIAGVFPNITMKNEPTAVVVRSVEQLGDVGWTSFKDAFNGCTGMTSFAAGTCDTSAVTDFSVMFGACSALTAIDLSGMDTSAAVYLGSMFTGCISLVTLDLSMLDTSNVTSASSMFVSCEVLESVDTTGWNTSKMHTFYRMFRKCYALQTIDLSHWDTSKATTFNSMFQSANALTDIVGIENWNVEGINTTAGLGAFVQASFLLPLARYNTLLTNWGAQTLFPDVVASLGSSQYTDQAARDVLTNAPNNWVITDGGAA